MDGGVHRGSYRFVDGDPHAVGLLLGCATADYPGGAGWYPTCPGGIIRTAIHRLRRRSWSVLDVDASLPAARDVPPNRSVHLRQTFPGGHPHRDHRAVYDRRPMADTFQHPTKTQTILAAIAAVQASVNTCLSRLASLTTAVNSLNAKVNIIMSEQSQLDAEAQQIEAAEASTAASEADTAAQLQIIATEVAALQAANPELDLTAINNALAAAQANTTTAASVDTSAQADATAAAPTTPVTGS